MAFIIGNLSRNSFMSRFFFLFYFEMWNQKQKKNETKWNLIHIYDYRTKVENLFIHHISGIIRAIGIFFLQKKAIWISINECFNSNFFSKPFSKQIENWSIFIAKQKTLFIPDRPKTREKNKGKKMAIFKEKKTLSNPSLLLLLLLNEFRKW